MRTEKTNTDGEAISATSPQTQPITGRTEPEVAVVAGKASPLPSSDFGLDMSSLTIEELVTAFEAFRTLSDVTCGILGQPRCAGAVNRLFDDFLDRLHWEWSKTIDEIERRTPRDEAEKHARSYAIVAASIDESEPLDACLAAAQARIDRKVSDCEVAECGRARVKPSLETRPITGRAETEAAAYDLNDLQSDLGHLHELLEQINDNFMDVDFVHDGQRDDKLDRISALAWIARDLTSKMSLTVESDFRSIGSTCKARPVEA